MNPAKVSFRNKGKIQVVLDKRLRGFVTGRPVLSEILKVVSGSSERTVDSNLKSYEEIKEQ